MKKTKINKQHIYGKILKKIKKIKLKQIMYLLLLSGTVIVLVFMFALTMLFLSATREFSQNNQNERSYCGNLERSNRQNDVYKDNEFGFEISYPSYLSDPAVNEEKNSKKSEVQKSISFVIDQNSAIWIYIWNIEAIREEGSPETEYNALNINSQKAWQSKDVKELNYENGSSKKYLLNTYIYSQSQVYQIDYVGSNNEENMQLYNDMVSSFIINQ